MTLTLRLWAGALLIKLYLLSYQIRTKFIKWSGKYKLSNNFNLNVEADAGDSAIAHPGLLPGKLKTAGLVAV